MTAVVEYTGKERSTSARDACPEPPYSFLIRPPGLPAPAEPLYDDQAQAIIGFRWETGGVTTVYDLDGAVREISEAPLESPLFDPFDLIFIAGGLFRTGGKAGIRAITAAAAGKGIATRVGAATLAALRAAARALGRGDLQFTVTTAKWMATRGRYVPVQILRLAIRHGRRGPDPDGVAGAFEYTIPMFRNGVRYTLKVVLREVDNTVLHFHYFR